MSVVMHGGESSGAAGRVGPARTGGIDSKASGTVQPASGGGRMIIT